MILVLSPPFDHTAMDPGYIKGYIPGVRENGGQYTHAATWVVLALTKLGSGDEAVELFHMLNPVNHSRTPDGAEKYMPEPYAGARRRLRPPRPPRPRRLDLVHRLRRLDVPGGARGILGLRRKGEVFSLDPCIPTTWPGFKIEWRVGQTKYNIEVENPQRRCRGVAQATLDGAAVDPAKIPLVDDGRTHQVKAVLG